MTKKYFRTGDADHLNGSDDEPPTGSCVDVRSGNDDDHTGSRDHEGWNGYQSCDYCFKKARPFLKKCSLLNF